MMFLAIRGADPRRFCWDAWNVQGQYRLLRTPAYHFFPKALYERFHQEVVLWGRKNLGCHDISPPWMSCYLEGAEQNFHGDLPHGPWSFVFSLTPWKQRTFLGGETLMLRDEALDFWRMADLSHGMEQDDILEAIAPEMNRLVVFDPRIPHGVRRVSGAHDVREGRLVVHGWFVNPRPYIEGPLRERELKSALGRILRSVDEVIQAGGFELDGMVSFRFTVAKNGLVSRVMLLTHSLRARGGDSLAGVSDVLEVVQNTIQRERFARHSSISSVTLPLVFSSRNESTPR